MEYREIDFSIQWSPSKTLQKMPSACRFDRHDQQQWQKLDGTRIAAFFDDGTEATNALRNQ
jgi:hypothetical protein